MAPQVGVGAPGKLHLQDRGSESTLKGRNGSLGAPQVALLAPAFPRHQCSPWDILSKAQGGSAPRHTVPSRDPACLVLGGTA